MICIKTVAIIFLILLLGSVGAAQIDRSSIEDYIKNLSLNQTSYDLQNKTPGIIKNISQEISKINSSDVQNLTHQSVQMLANITLDGIDLPDLPNDSTPYIKLEDVHTDVGTPDLLGYHPDCTFILNNTGDADGVAIINFEKDNQILMKKSYFLVPAKAARKFNEKFDLPFLSFGQASITCYIEDQRKATRMDYYDITIRKN